MEVLGMIMLRVSEPNLAKIRITMDNREDRPVQFQVRNEREREREREQLFLCHVLVY